MQKVLVPLDGSAFAERAIETARALVTMKGGALEFVTVHEPGLPPSRISGAPPLDPRLDNEIRTNLRAYLARIEAAERGRSAFPVTSAFREGDVGDEVAAQVTTGGADLVVMTTHGRGGVDRFWIGSVADHLIRSAVVPVLLVRSTAESGAVPLGRIVVAVAGSDDDDRIIGLLVEVSDLPRCQITLVHVLVPSPTLAAVDARLGPPPDEMAGLPTTDTRDTDHAASRYLEWMAGPLRTGGAVVDTKVMLDGSAARAVLSVAESIKADLVVVGTAARPPIARMFIGSVADKIVRSAHCSVLVSPARPPVQETRL